MIGSRVLGPSGQLLTQRGHCPGFLVVELKATGRFGNWTNAFS